MKFAILVVSIFVACVSGYQLSESEWTRVETRSMVIPKPMKRGVPAADGVKMAPRIIGGSQAANGQFPHQAALFLNHATETYFCGGSILSLNYVSHVLLFLKQ